MKKSLLGIPLALLLMGAGCPSTTTVSPSQQPVPAAYTPPSAPAQNPPPQQTPPAITTHSFITVNATIKKGVRHEDSISIYSETGALQKTLPFPDSFLNNRAGNLRTAGMNIYILTGTEKVTMISKIDPASGVVSELPFTQSKNFNVGNVLSAIPAWTISNDENKVAWWDTRGVIHVANIDGSQAQTFATSAALIRGWLEFTPGNDALYTWGTQGTAVNKIDLASGTTTKAFESLNGEFTTSPSFRYVAYQSDKNLEIKDLSTDHTVVVPIGNYDYASDIIFSPDEKTVMFSASIAYGPQALFLVDIDGKHMRKVASNVLGFDFATNGQLIVDKDDATYIMNADGSQSKKLSDGFYEGALTTRF